MFWKRPVNINLLTMVAAILLIFAFAANFGFSAIFIQMAFPPSFFELDPDVVGEETAEAWARIGEREEFADINLTEEADLASGVLFVMTLLLLGGAFIMLVLIIIARCVYRSQDSGLLKYRILMGIAYALLAVLTAMFIPIFLPVTIILAIILVFNMVNTYSKRIMRY